MAKAISTIDGGGRAPSKTVRPVSKNLVEDPNRRAASLRPAPSPARPSPEQKAAPRRLTSQPSVSTRSNVEQPKQKQVDPPKLRRPETSQTVQEKPAAEPAREAEKPALRRKTATIDPNRAKTPGATGLVSGGGGVGGRGGFALSRGSVTTENKDDKPDEDLVEIARRFGEQKAEERAQERVDNPFVKVGDGIESFFAGLGKQIEESSDRRKAEDDAKDRASEALGEPVEAWQLHNPVVQQVTNKVEKEDAREDYSKGFVTKTNVQVRELTPDEWAALSPEQQQGVITNYALYEASLADKEAGLSAEEADQSYLDLVNDTFGSEGGSDTYAPNTMRLLSELGFSDEKGDLDYFLNGGAIASLEAVQGKPYAGEAGAAEVFQTLSNSDVFKNEDLSAQLAAGQGMIDAIRNTGTLTNEFLAFADPSMAISPEDASELDVILKNMTNRGVWSQLQEDPSTGQILQEDLDAVTARLTPEVVSRYFTGQLKDWQGDQDYMSYDEFSQNWLGGN